MPDATPPTSNTAKNHRALIVRSGPEIDQLLTNLFQQEQFEIQFAAQNAEALQHAKDSPFDVIITGERTPGKEDIELLRRLRMVRPHTRLIILTEEFIPGDVLAAIRERAFSYFSRPFSTERLAEMIRIAMSEPFWDDGIEVLHGTPNWVRLCVRCDLATANRLLQFYREASELPDAETEEVATAFREILMNAMEHGGKFDPSQHVEVSYVRTRRMVLCRVKDPGQGFSLEEIQHSAIANPDDDPFKHMETREAQGKRPGGFGILMATKLVDDLIYNEKGNEVLLVKYLDKPAAASHS
ncbi:MAG TPA: ATP-binding protein [Candidatus Acidoferrum sp.]|jgi:DNA-binding response OmpR family regulator|nr:ATP-binding protein [Candidatus Acidoferrum sp.]